MFDLNKIRHIHFTGIKGVGMTAIAQCAKDMGIKVTGSDLEEIFVTDETLEKKEIKWQIGFAEKNLHPKPDLLVTTGAHGGLNNPEVLEAKKKGIKVITYAEALGLFANTKKLISVCGVGGKGSTASLIAWIFEYARKNPSFAIGMGNILPLGASGAYKKKGKYFICEADEYAISPGVNNNPKFSLLNPYITITTNIEHDHPDIYPTFADTEKVYKDYFSRIPDDGILIVNFDNRNNRKTLKDYKKRRLTYGFDNEADWFIKKYSFSEGQTEFLLENLKEGIFRITTHLPGKFNILNSVAGFLAAKMSSISIENIIKALENFEGARRRFEIMGNMNGAIFYDDYAHHPTEIVEVLKATREWYPNRRIVAIFQPHTYSRTKALLGGFSKSFKEADVVGIMDIYASARELKDDSVSSALLVDKIKKYQDKVNYLEGHINTLEWISREVKKGDVVLTIGAGDIFHLYNGLKLKKVSF